MFPIQAPSGVPFFLHNMWFISPVKCPLQGESNQIGWPTYLGRNVFCFFFHRGESTCTNEALLLNSFTGQTDTAEWPSSAVFWLPNYFHERDFGLRPLLLLGHDSPRRELNIRSLVVNFRRFPNRGRTQFSFRHQELLNKKIPPSLFVNPRRFRRTSKWRHNLDTVTPK